MDMIVASASPDSVRTFTSVKCIVSCHDTVVDAGPSGFCWVRIIINDASFSMIIVSPNLVFAVTAPNDIVTELTVQVVISYSLTVDPVVAPATMDIVTVICRSGYTSVYDIVTTLCVFIVDIFVTILSFPVTKQSVLFVGAVNDIITVVAIEVIVIVDVFGLVRIVGPDLIIAVSTIQIIRMSNSTEDLVISSLSKPIGIFTEVRAVTDVNFIVSVVFVTSEFVIILEVDLFRESNVTIDLDVVSNV